MAQLISGLIALFIVHGIPYLMDRKAEQKRLADLYSGRNNNDHSTDEWRR